MSRLISLVKGQCPNCENGDVFKSKLGFRYGKMNDSCSNCHHKFDKEPGFFLGAMYASYALGIAEAVGAFIIAQFFFTEVLNFWMIPIVLGTIIMFSGFNYNYSRVIWMYMFTKKGTSKSQTTPQYLEI
ncbi:hypothetical protein [Crocinitomix catalasitica]|uniref:hypothetical protein n=1 Tax=Crocinitomix catalasitica TaxID=184607 RepID=UPI0004838A96|nr:hypothetical protein [Crocinitomix catalasitica]